MWRAADLMDEVLPDLFVCGLNYTKLSTLEENSIKTVLTIREFALPVEPHTGIQYHFYKLEDTTNQNLAQYFPEITRVITAGLQRGRVLVHCQAGISRSVSGIICYMISTFNLTFDTALEIMRSNHRFSMPNMGFREQLETLYSTIADSWEHTPGYIYHRDKILKIEGFTRLQEY